MKKIILFDIDDTLFNTKHFIDTNLTEYFLYKEVPDVLESLKDHAVLGILSQGEKEFQMRKLYQTDIVHFFEEEMIHILADKKLAYESVFEKYRAYDQIIFVEDRREHLLWAKQALPSLIGVWMKRGRYNTSQAEEKDKHAVDFIVTNLTELLPLLSFER